MIANPGAGQPTWRYFPFFSAVVVASSLVQDHFLHILYHLCFSCGFSTFPEVGWLCTCLLDTCILDGSIRL
jgi:hypothetical protein